MDPRQCRPVRPRHLRQATRSEPPSRRALGGGFPDRALALAEEKRDLDVRRGEEREAALASGLIADVMEARGELDAALRIRREEELPVYERLGEVRAKAVTMGKIADVLFARGDLDAALRIRREEELPVYQRLGDVRAKAVTMGKIADVLFARGDLDEALRVRREEELPVYKRLGGRDLVIGRGNLALMLLTRNVSGDREEARGLLCLALADARRMRLAEAAQIEAFLKQSGLSCD